MKLFIALGSLLVVALLVLLIGPSFVNWTSYRSSFEAEASRILGQKVTVRGEAAARLLPFPSLSFTDVVVGDDPADPVLTVRGFRMDAELAPYLSGEIRIFDMRLEGPALTVPVEADGAIRWPVGAGAGLPDETVVLERIRIEDGAALLVDRRSNRRVALSRIEGTLSAQSLRGPFAGTATLLADDEPLAASLSTGMGAGEGRMAFRLTLESPRVDARLALDGVASSLPSEPLVDGALALASPIDPTAEPDTERPRLLPPFRLSAKLAATPTSLSATELRAEVGEAQAPYVATGSALIDVGSIPRFDLQLAGQAVDVDSVAPPVVAAGETPNLPARIEALRAALERLPTPQIPGRVRLALPLVTVGDTTIRNVSLAGSPASEGWSLQTLSAELPGRTLVEASGVLRTQGRPGFRGDLLLAARQPATFLSWAAGSSDPALARLQRAGFSAEVDLSPADQRFDALEIDLDGQSLAGSIHRSVRPEGNTTAIDLRGEAVDLQPIAALARLLALRDGAPRADERFDVQFSAGPARFGNFSTDGLDADLSLDRGLLDIASFDARAFAGTDIHAEGTLSDPFGFPRPDFSLEIASVEPARFTDFLRRRLPESPLLRALQARAPSLGPLSLSGTATSQGTNRADLALDLSGTAAGTDIGLRLALENGLAAAAIDGRFGLDLTLAQDDADVLLAQLGLPVLPIGATVPLDVSLKASGEPGRPAEVSLGFRSPGTELATNGSATFGSEGVGAASLALRLHSEDLSPWATRLALAFGQPLVGLPAQGEGRLSWANGGWTIEDLSGTLAGSRLAATLSAPMGAPVSGTLALSDLSLDWLATVMTGLDDGALEGEAAPFRSPLLPARAFNLALSAERAVGLGWFLSDLRAELAGEETRLAAANLAARTASGGRIAGAGEVRNVGGLLSADLDLDLRGQPVATDTDLLAGRFDIGGKVLGGGRTWPALLASLNGKGRLALEDGSLRGVRPDILEPVLAASGEEGFDPSIAAVGALVERLSAEARAPLSALAADWTLGAGVLRTVPMREEFASGALEGGVTFDVPGGRVEADLTQSLVPPADETLPDAAPAIGYRIAGPWKAPELAASVQPLANYLSALAYRREQERIEALQDDLRETVRLRREARLYRERERIRERLRQERLAREAEAREKAARLEAERLERLRAVEASREAEERAAREAAARAAAAQAEAEAARRAAIGTRAPSNATGEPPAPLRDFDLQPLPAPPTPGGFGGLPGVNDPNRL